MAASATTASAKAATPKTKTCSANCSPKPATPTCQAATCNPVKGAEAAIANDADRSPETYVGYARADNFAGGRLVHGDASDYRAPATLDTNQWALSGRWIVRPQEATLDATNGSITYRFRGRDLHLVLGPGSDGKPVRFRVTLDGHAPGADHGVDIDADGNGTVTAQRLYQLVRQAHGNGERTFTITFLDPGVRAYAFTFG